MNEEQQRIDLNVLVKSQAEVINQLSELCSDLISELLKYRNMDETQGIFEDIRKGGVII